MKKGILIILTLLVLILLGFQIYSSLNNKQNIKYVNTAELVQEFEMSKDMQQKLETVGISRKNYMDSLRIEIESLNRKIKSGAGGLVQAYEEKAGTYLKLKEDFDRTRQEMASQFDQQVFDQINKYIKSYAEENDIEYIIGVTGTGNLLYAKEENNITKDLIKYVNLKYKK